MRFYRSRVYTRLIVFLGFLALKLFVDSDSTSFGQSIAPVPLPTTGISGFKFPESEDTINKWISSNDQTAIARHAWGIWTALTSPTNEVFEGQKLLVFETWDTPEDISTAHLTQALTLKPKRNPLPLAPLRQLNRLRLLRAESPGSESAILGFVKLDPVAVKHIQDDKLFSKKVLKNLLSSGQAMVPAFDPQSISLKVVFAPLSRSQLVDGRYAMLPAWPGPPNPAKPFPTNDWGQCIWIDTSETGVGPGTGKVDTQCKADGSSRTPETTYGLGRFIYFRQSSAQVAVTNALRAAAPPDTIPLAIEGDPAVLLGMHVTSREITRWTWQTFWWEPNPDHPHAPSSDLIASARPSELKGPARNYAHAASYSTEFPSQPTTGGTNSGNSIYAYNPWLESGFGPDDLRASLPGTSEGQPVENNVGVQTNCMSCHAQACFSPDGKNMATKLYTGDRYIDANGPQFKGLLRTEFLWSIPDNAQ